MGFGLGLSISNVGNNLLVLVILGFIGYLIWSRWKGEKPELKEKVKGIFRRDR